MSIQVYTAIARDYDALQLPEAAPGIRWVAFLDEERIGQVPPSAWELRPVSTRFDDPTRNAKVHKVLSHLEFPEAELTVWIDGSVRILDAPALFGLWELLSDAELAVFEHRHRTCVYQEAAVCLERRLDDAGVIWRQVCGYTRDGFPANRGLSECPVIVRRNTRAVRRFNECWWQEIQGGSRRDQLSVDYAVRRSKVRRIALPGTIPDNPFFERKPHKLVRDEKHISFSTSVSSGPPASMVRRRHRKIAIGPVRSTPSWMWVGYDLGRELSKYYDVELFDSFSVIPRADLVLVVKQRPTVEFIDRCRAPVVYCPIDIYASEAEIRNDSEALARYRSVLVHSPRLIEYLRPFAEIHSVEHHVRFALNEAAQWRDAGFVLWVGGLEHVPHLLQWLRAHPCEAEIRLLTNHRNERVREAADAIASGLLGGPLDLLPSEAGVRLWGMQVRDFSERRQVEWMRECCAGMDIKGEDFSQATKPATKAQQFVASGIPTAVNPGSAPWEWFHRRGFDLASPLDTDRWFSRAYFEATREVAVELRQELSLEAVGKRYVEILESL